MVVFTCNACSAVLKRNKVDSHCYQCRGCESLSCVDCGKDFWGNDYQQHTKCISEEEKYGRKDTVHRANKGEVKQEQWVEQVQAAIDNASSKPNLKRLLERIKQYPNIPRKKAKFENFVKNSLKCYETKLIAASWDVLMANKIQKQEVVQEKQAEPVSITNGHEKEEMNGNDQADEETSKCSSLKSKKERKEERRKKSQKKEKKDKAMEVAEDEPSNDVSKKSKKRKRQEMEDDENQHIENNLNKGDNLKKKKNKNKEVESTQREDNGECNNDDRLEGEEEEEEVSPPKKRKKAKFDWEEVVKTVLKKKGELPLKKLKRKVLSEFAAQDAANYNEDNLSAKFDKKVTKMKGVKVSKDRAILKA